MISFLGIGYQLALALLFMHNCSFQVLFWLKQWDSTVFGTDIRNTGDEVLSALRRHSSLPHNQKVTGVNFMRKSWGDRSTENYKGHSAMMEQEHNKAKGIPGLQSKKLNGLGIPDQKVSISNYGLSFTFKKSKAHQSA